ncbi:MAG: hypothetical protein WD691_01190 [Acidimicrobiales bacterium]
MRRHAVLAMWTALVMVVAVTALVADRLDIGAAGSDQIIRGPDGTAGSTTTVPPVVVPGPGQVRVSGTLSALRLGGAILDPRSVAMPVTMTASRGFGNGAEVTGVRVDGKRSTIVWDGGRPFELSGTGAVIPSASVVEIVPQGLRIMLGGGVHSLAAGTYRLDTPVAVGTSGIATPRDSVEFEASAESLLDVRGDASIILGAGPPVRLLGPGSIEMHGTFELTDASGMRDAESYLVDVAAFDLTIAGGTIGRWRITGLIDTSNAP